MYTSRLMIVPLLDTTRNNHAWSLPKGRSRTIKINRLPTAVPGVARWGENLRHSGSQCQVVFSMTDQIRDYQQIDGPFKPSR